MLVQSSLATSLPGQVPGGFKTQLPKDLIGSTPAGYSAPVSMAWVYRNLTSASTYILEGQDGFTTLHIRIDCHGVTAALADQLAQAIDNVFRGAYSGTLPDPDATVVQGIFSGNDFSDGYADDTRTFVHTLEYLVNYNQQ